MALATGACYGQPVYIPAPEILPSPFGIFSVSDMQTLGDAADPHWQQGVEWESEPGYGQTGVYACPTCVQNNGGTAPAKAYVTGVPLVQGFPFTVYASFKCSPIGRWEDGFDRARRGLLNGEERAVEGEIALGTKHNGNSLTAATTVDVTPTAGTPVTPVQGLAILEQYIRANAAGQGTILITARDLTLIDTMAILISEEDDDEPNNRMLLTRLETPVAALGGFDGRTGPNGTAAGAGKSWMFALGGRPKILRSDIFTMPEDKYHALSQRTNDFAVLAERTYVMNWDYFTAAVLITSV